MASPIEQQVNGVEKMAYMTSQSNNDGSYTLDVTFAVGTDVNMAQVLVQNRVAIAQPALPDVVKAIGVTVKKRSPDILLIVNLYSEIRPDTGQPYYDQLYLTNYATINLQDILRGSMAWATSRRSAARTTACGCGSTRTSCNRGT